MSYLSSSRPELRQLGNTFGVTAATHSTLGQYADLIHRNVGATSDPAQGALQLFQSNVIT